MANDRHPHRAFARRGLRDKGIERRRNIREGPVRFHRDWSGVRDLFGGARDHSGKIETVYLGELVATAMDDALVRLQIVEACDLTGFGMGVPETQSLLIPLLSPQDQEMEFRARLFFQIKNHCCLIESQRVSRTVEWNLGADERPRAQPTPRSADQRHRS